MNIFDLLTLGILSAAIITHAVFIIFLLARPLFRKKEKAQPTPAPPALAKSRSVDPIARLASMSTFCQYPNLEEYLKSVLPSPSGETSDQENRMHIEHGSAAINPQFLKPEHRSRLETCSSLEELLGPDFDAPIYINMARLSRSRRAEFRPSLPPSPLSHAPSESDSVDASACSPLPPISSDSPSADSATDPATNQAMKTLMKELVFAAAILAALYIIFSF